MITRRKKPTAPSVARPDPEQRRALQVLATSEPSGLTEAIMFDHGFSIQSLAGIVHAQLADVEIGAVRAGGSTIAVLRLRITAAGRKAIEDA